jgi:hypothetical protein
MSSCFEDCDIELNIFLNRTSLEPSCYTNMFYSYTHLKTKRIFIGVGASPGNLVA